MTIHTVPVGPPTLDHLDQKILDAIADGDGLSTAQVAAAISLTTRATGARLARLAGQALIREIVTGPNEPTGRYLSAR